jgi:Tn3 transposase DDE domain
VLTTLGLSEDPGALLASHVTALDEALRYAGGRLAANADVRVDEAGRIHVTSDKAIAEPPSLVDLRRRVAAMLPRVDIGEQILEVMGWVPQFLESLTAPSGGAARMADLNVTVAACLTGQALNIGYGPVSSPGVPALERRRIGHAGRTYLRAAGYTAANPHLIAQQAGIGFARALGGRMVAAIDGMRFVVPVPSLMAKPNRKYFGSKRGITFLNVINDQAFGTGHKIVAGTDRDCLHAIDLFFSPGAANLPEVLVTDTSSYSDLIFGIAACWASTAGGHDGPVRPAGGRAQADRWRAAISVQVREPAWALPQPAHLIGQPAGDGVPAAESGVLPESGSSGAGQPAARSSPSAASSASRSGGGHDLVHP